MSTKDFIKKSVLNAFTQYDAPKLAVALLVMGFYQWDAHRRRRAPGRSATSSSR